MLNHSNCVELGRSFYLADINRFEERFIEFWDAFKHFYPKTDMSYSFKTNYLPAFCSKALQLGIKAEVVSIMELELALKLGFNAENIIFNGPSKTENGIELAIKSDAILQIDSYSELGTALTLSKRLNKNLNLGIRINTGIFNSRFGVPLNEIDAVINTVKESESVRLKSIHCHLMPPSKSAKGYEQITNEMIKVYEVFVASGLTPEYLNMGGGFASPMPKQLTDQLNFTPPTFSQYAQAIAGAMANEFSFDNGPKLILEPGLAVVAEAMQFYTQVNRINKYDERKVATCFGSVYNIKPTKNRLNLPLQIISSKDKKTEQSIFQITGSTCMEDDIMYSEFKGVLNEGDYLEFSNVGAYTNVLYPPFITPQCAIYNKQTKALLKSADSGNDILKNYLS